MKLLYSWRSCDLQLPESDARGVREEFRLQRTVLKILKASQSVSNDMNESVS